MPREAIVFTVLGVAFLAPIVLILAKELIVWVIDTFKWGISDGDAIIFVILFFVGFGFLLGALVITQQNKDNQPCQVQTTNQP